MLKVINTLSNVLADMRTERKLSLLVFASTILLLGAISSSPLAFADTVCNGSFDSGTFDDNLVVGSGDVCELRSVTVNGNIQVNDGGTLLMSFSTLNGNVEGDGAFIVSVQHTTIDGNIITTGTSVFSAIGSNTITGNIDVQGSSSAFSLIFDNVVLGKRYYLDHTYKLIGKNRDSSYVEKTSLSLGHTFGYETKYYQFMQSAGDSYFGDVILSPVNDKANLKTTYNQVSLEFYNRTLGRLQGNVNMFHYNYFFNSVFYSEEGQEIQSQLNGTELALGGEYEKRIGGFELIGSFKYNLSGDLSGNIFDASAAYSLNERNRLRFHVHSSSRMPNFNFLLYQSEYLNYNWQNTDTFKKERVNSLELNLDSDFFGNISAKYTNLDNYAYFSLGPNPEVVEGSEQANIKPFQEDTGISYLKLKYAKEFRLGKFALNNTLMYQTVSQESNVFNVPQLVTRNTLYFSSDVFKKAMYLQTGVTLKYFTKYNMNGYNPVLGEFFVQETEELGGFPLLDFFINARIQQTRIFLKAEHFNSSFSGYNYYAAPNYPYRDFVIRFGLVWNFFS